MTLHRLTTEVPRPPAMFCRTCRRALSVLARPNGGSFRHTDEARGGTVDHRPDPVPLSDITDPIIKCDFCSAPDAVWLYECADQVTDARVVTARTVGAGDYHRRHYAARTRSVETAETPLHVWGERWSACTGCADLIEARDLYGLISRVTDAMPAKYTRGRRLAPVRGQLHANYSTVLATLRPGRNHITSARSQPRIGDDHEMHRHTGRHTLMTATVTHAQANQHAGPVCGADDGPLTRVSDDPMLITCPDCPDLIWIEALPHDATSGDPTVIEALRDVRRGHMRKVDGLIMDATTANAILTVWDAMKPATRAKFLTLDINRMAAVAWRVINPQR